MHQDSYLRTTAGQLWDNLPQVLLAGFVFSALCLPTFFLFAWGLFIPAVALAALSIAPAWAALLAHEADILRRGGARLCGLFAALPRLWARSAAFGLLAALPVLAALWTLPHLGSGKAPVALWLGLAADWVGLLVFSALSVYVFPLFVLHDLGLRAALHNALLLASRHLGNTLGLVGMAVLCALATGHLSSGLVFFWPATWGAFLLSNCRMVVDAELAAEGRATPGYEAPAALPRTRRSPACVSREGAERYAN